MSLSGAHRRPSITRALRVVVAAVVPVAAAVALLGGPAGPRGAHAEGAEGDHVETRERCGLRLSIALQGKSPDPALLASSDPQAAVADMVGSPEFTERYARFINAQFNGAPSATAAEDPVYYLAKYVLEKQKPWSDLFVGPYAITAASATATEMVVAEDEDGLGYFRSPAWMKRYAGNEDQGMMLVAAFRILSDTTGLTLVASVGAPGEKRDATGRAAAACKGCHFDSWYALDKFAKLLPRKKTSGDTVTFTPPPAGTQDILGKSIADDRAMVGALVDSDAWRVAQCRNVFRFLYGRVENQCEARAFDACVDALSGEKTLQAAVAAVAKDPSFCQ